MAMRIGGLDVLYKKALPLSDPAANFDGLKPSKQVLPKGFRKTPANREFSGPTIWERDVAVPMRDGIILRADIFRPAGTDEKVPCILVWSPYGKSSQGRLSMAVVQGNAGVPESELSGFQSFEAPDPAEWVPHGYAIANVNARGVLGSEGRHRWHGVGEGQDGHDTIEFLGTREWCDGNVAMMGNSWLATAQWFIAAERPPHLTCMLPLEGLSDVYRETLCRGGVPFKPFWAFLMTTFFSDEEQEDVISMIEKYPLMNEYWEDKRGKAHLIEVPTYVLASMSTLLHTEGSTRCYEEIPHDKKWLRLHGTQEWHDLYQKDSVADFKKFLDFYMKGIQNDWESTPRVRATFLRYNQPPIENLPFSSWPVLEAKYEKFFFSDNAKLAARSPPTKATVSFLGDAPAIQMDNDPEEVVFEYTFEQKTRLLGTSKAVLYMSCPDHDDFDVFVQLRKADKDGNILTHINIPIKDLGVASGKDVGDINPLKFLGPAGVLRASHRAIDPILSEPHRLHHDHTKQDKVPPGEIVRLDIPIWVAAIEFDAGEKLMVKVAGHEMRLAEFEPLRGQFRTDNRGRQVVHFGGEFDSHVEIPFVPVS
ncbi:PepX-C domain-containing protein [Fusarium keratoplasticum]|nr:PepX-C domain-containing protein [Fusarium keratoplasticum]